MRILCRRAPLARAALHVYGGSPIATRSWLSNPSTYCASCCSWEVDPPPLVLGGVGVEGFVLRVAGFCVGVCCAWLPCRETRPVPHADNVSKRRRMPTIGQNILLSVITMLHHLCLSVLLHTSRIHQELHCSGDAGRPKGFQQ